MANEENSSEMNYWNATALILQKNNGKNPVCSIHNIEMFAADDHGRFICPKCGFGKQHDLFGPTEPMIEDF